MILEVDINAVEDLAYWIKKEKKKAEKILKLVKSISHDPFKGEGKPEPLKFNLSGCWSRRIDQEHRFVYTVQENKIRILSCRYHY
jgi:toxin YoeB